MNYILKLLGNYLYYKLHPCLNFGFVVTRDKEHNYFRLKLHSKLVCEYWHQFEKHL